MAMNGSKCIFRITWEAMQAIVSEDRGGPRQRLWPTQLRGDGNDLNGWKSIHTPIILFTDTDEPFFDCTALDRRHFLL